MKKIYVSILVLFLFTSCNTLKLIKVLKKGSVEQKEFKTEIPFEMRLGLVIIPVTINGKTYEFLVDTGAPNVCSKELAAELNLKTKVSQNTGDSQGVKEKLDFVVVPEIYLSGICFKETGAAVADLKHAEVISCLDIDGIIGANLMKEAIWEFDYERKVITISDKKSSFTIPDNAIHLPFTPALSSTPEVTITYNGVEDKYVTFDTGSNGLFTISKSTLEKIEEKKPPVKKAMSFGSSGSGLYGVAKADTSYMILIDSTQVGGLFIENNAVSVENGAKLIGTKFLKNFRVIIDWNVKEILLIPVKPFVNNTFESFGFSPFISDNKLIINELYMNSEASEKGIKIGTQILAVDGIDYRTCSADQFCAIIERGLVPEGKKTMTLLVLIDGEEKTLQLTKEDLLK
ncbi:MAG: aspartyl protease family protein [Fluviicola sp.]